MTTALVTAPATALGENPPRAQAKVALVDAIDLPDRMDETRARIRELFEKSVQERGLVAVPAGAPACHEAGCLAEVARAVGADAVILARGGRSAERDYHIELGLWQASNGQVVPAVADCTFCTGPQMADAVVKAARPLLDRIGVTQMTALQPPAPPAPPAPAVPPASDKLEPHRGRQIVGWSLVGLGAATAIAGGIIWNLDGQGTDCGGAGSVCRNVYATRNEGIALVIVGAVGAGAGLWLALDPLGGRDLAVTVGPSGASLAGSF